MFIDVAVNIGVMAIILTIISLIITVILVIARKKQWKKALFTAGISFLIIFIAGFSAKFYQMHEDTVGGSPAESQLPNDTENYFVQGEKIDGAISDIGADNITSKLIEIGFTEEEAEGIKETFLLCGLTDIRGFEKTDPSASIDGLVSYRNEIDNDRTAWFTIENRKLFYIALNGVDVYDSDKGGFLININDVHIPESYVSPDVADILHDLTEQTLDGYFVNALYYDGFGYGREDNNYMVQCQVEAKNRLGTKDWVYAKVWYEWKDDGFVVTGVVIDGQQYK